MTKSSLGNSMPVGDGMYRGMSSTDFTPKYLSGPSGGHGRVILCFVLLVLDCCFSLDSPPLGELQSLVCPH